MTKDLNDMPMEELKTQIDRNHQEYLKERAEKEAKLYADGFRWYADACVHPEAGGDDYTIALYFVDKPTDKDVERELRKAGSCLVDGQYTEPKELKDPNDNKKERVMTTKEKLAELNKLRAAKGMKPLKSWKQSVAKLGEAINKLLNTEATVEEEDKPKDKDPIDEAMDKVMAEGEIDEKYVTLNERFETIRKASEFMLLERDGDNEGLPYKFILRCIRANFPKAKTSLACLRWYANKMNQAGTVMPPRKSGNRKK